MRRKYIWRERKRPFWIWPLALLWLVAEVVMVQTAVASMWEFESKAAMFSWVIFVVLLALGGMVWVLARPDDR